MKAKLLLISTIFMVLNFTAYAAPEVLTVMHRDVVDERCREEIRNAVQEKSLEDFKNEVNEWKAEPMVAGHFTLNGTEKWKLTKEIDQYILFSNESRPFEGSVEKLPDGMVALKSYVLAIFPNPRNTKGASLGYMYVLTTKLRPIRMLFPYKKDSMDGTDKQEGYVLSDSLYDSCPIEFSEKYHLGSKLSDLQNSTLQDEEAAVQEIYKKYLKRK